MKVCQYPSGCNRPARYLQNLNNEKGKHFGLVCAIHDRELGRANLMQSAGMSLGECILFERYLALTVNLTEYLDWPEWLKQYAQLHGKPSDTIRAEISLKELNLSPRTFNALYRHQINTIDELEDMSEGELMKIRWIGKKGVAETQKALKEHNG